MNKYFKEKLVALGFKETVEDLFSMVTDIKLFSTYTHLQVFACFKDGKCYLKDNGDIVESFDAPDIDIEYMLGEIASKLKEYGCELSVSNIVKETDINSLEKDLKSFIQAVKIVDQMYKAL